MQAFGNIVEDKIIIKKPRDIGRFYSKSGFGKIVSGEKLELDLIEGMFLLDEGKIKLYKDKEEINFQELVIKAAKNISNFKIKYYVYKDLRKRGHVVKISDIYEDFTFYIKKNSQMIYISAFSEMDLIKIIEVENLIKKSQEKKAELWFAIVDEEGDLTYYSVCFADVKGYIPKYKLPTTYGFLLGNSVVIFDKKSAKNLFEKEFFGKTFGEGLQLSMVESLYLLEKGLLEIKSAEDEKRITKNDFIKFIKKFQPDIKNRINVYNDLKKKGLLVKTGFKFGAHFRVYTKKPGETHAEYLVHVIDKKFVSIWAEIGRAVRLAHSVNKEIIFSIVNKNNIKYIKFGRLRP